MRRLAPLSSDLCVTFFHLLYLFSPYIKVMLGQPQIIMYMSRSSTMMISLSCWFILMICWLLD